MEIQRIATTTVTSFCHSNRYGVSHPFLEMPAQFKVANPFTLYLSTCSVAAAVAVQQRWSYWSYLQVIESSERIERTAQHVQVSKVYSVDDFCLTSGGVLVLFFAFRSIISSIQCWLISSET